jgi:quinol monooxygenase YgiN
MDSKAQRGRPGIAIAEGNASVSEDKSVTGDKDKKMIQVVVEIVAKAGQREAVLKAFKANVPAVHAEQGCIEYAAFVDAAGFGSLAPYGDNTFIVIEKWESASHLKAHAKAPHTLEYQAKVKDLIESRTIHVLALA